MKLPSFKADSPFIFKSMKSIAEKNGKLIIDNFETIFHVKPQYFTFHSEYTDLRFTARIILLINAYAKFSQESLSWFLKFQDFSFYF